MRCPSCDVVLGDYEVGRKTPVEVEDGRVILIEEDMCYACMERYVYGADELDTHSYVHSESTDDLRQYVNMAISHANTDFD